MPDNTNTTKDPNHDQSNVDHKRCDECIANLPMSAYGMDRYQPSGYSTTCKECRTQYSRLQRKAKWNAKSLVDDSIIRGINAHNRQALAKAFSTMKSGTFFGFAYDVTNPSRTLPISISDIGGTHVKVVIKDDYQITWPHNIKDSLAIFTYILRERNLRLEISDVDMINSKAIIYGVSL